jgi:hypothetical protein
MLLEIANALGIDPVSLLPGGDEKKKTLEDFFREIARDEIKKRGQV